jgi:hypothetical protein
MHLYRSTSILLLASICLSACNQHYYAPALYKNNISYQAKPMSGDSVKSATYVSGGLGAATGVSLSDDIYMGQLSLDRAHTFDNLNIAYGVFGYAGSYENTTLQPTDAHYFTNQSFAGIGARGSANLSIPLKNVDLRVIGVEFSYSKEFGAYADFRSAVKSDQNFYTDASNVIFGGGLTTEVAWRGRHNPQLHYAARGYVGTTFGNHALTNNFDAQREYTSDQVNVGASFFMQVNNT